MSDPSSDADLEPDWQGKSPADRQKPKADHLGGMVLSFSMHPLIHFM
jgi:hypothetical protein